MKHILEELEKLEVLYMSDCSLNTL